VATPSASAPAAATAAAAEVSRPFAPSVTRRPPSRRPQWGPARPQWVARNRAPILQRGFRR
jgi:hypothetical protein